MDTNDLFAVAKILAELNRLRFDFKLIICGKEFKNATDKNFSIYHWRYVLKEGLEDELKREADNKISYDLVLSLGDAPKKYCKVQWDDSIRRYKFSMQIGRSLPLTKTFYSLISEETNKEIIKMIGSY